MRIVAAIFTALTIIPGAAKEEMVNLPEVSAGGSTYKAATISLEGRITAKISHESGVTRVPAAQLPAEVYARLADPLPTATAKRDVHISALGETSPERAEIIKNIIESESVGTAVMPLTVTQVLDGMLLATTEDYSTVAVVGDTERRADDDKINLPLVDSGKIFRYSTVLGAEKNVRIYKVSRPPSAGAILRNLKAGATYTIPLGVVEVTCMACNGKPVACPVCSSTGKYTSRETVTVTR